MSTQGHPERSAARLVAVQALYQIEFTGAPWQDVVLDHTEYRIHDPQRPAAANGEDPEGQCYVADGTLFQSIVAAVMTRAEEIDQAIASCLPAEWSPDRLDPVLRAAFRAAGAELLNATGTPTSVIVSEYVKTIAEFGDEPKEIAFANGVLSGLAAALRPEVTA